MRQTLCVQLGKSDVFCFFFVLFLKDQGEVLFFFFPPLQERPMSVPTTVHTQGLQIAGRGTVYGIFVDLVRFRVRQGLAGLFIQGPCRLVMGTPSLQDMSPPAYTACFNCTYSTYMHTYTVQCYPLSCAIHMFSHHHQSTSMYTHIHTCSLYALFISLHVHTCLET